MYRLNPGCWVWSPRRPVCLHLQHSGSLHPAMMSHQEEEEEEEEEAGKHHAACCYTTGCHDFIKLSADSQCSASGLTGRGPGAPSSQQPFPHLDVASGGNVSQHFTGGCCWEGPRMETQGCVCVYGQKEPDSLGPCWPGSPYVYTLRSNLVVGVEVVEEVAVEDTLEVITEDIYTDDFLDPELLEDVQLYPT